MKKIYVGNLAHSVTDEALQKAFEQFGKVDSARVMKDRFTGEARGFGFVAMPEDEQAEQAITGMNGRELEGRRLRVNEAREQEPRPRTGGGNRFGGGDRDRGGSRDYNGGGGGWRSRS